MKILIFGGTFDPVHLGHETMLKEAQKKVQPNLTLIIPNKIPPMKKNKTFTSGRDRLNMLKIAFRNFKNTKISSIELTEKNNNFSYTIYTLKKVREKFPLGKLFLLIGGDRFNDFDKWKKSEEILQLVERIIVLKRKNNKIKNNKKFFFLNTKEIPISSNDLREKLNISWINKGVLDYIIKNNLYIENYLLSLMTPYRLNHSKRVARTAVKIAKIHDKKLVRKAFIAGMFHDICKEFKNDKIEELVGKKGKSYPNTHTKHGIAGSIYLKKELKLTDREILDAIKDHVIPKNNSPILTKIIYCADKLEPKRKSKKDVSSRIKYMRMIKTDLNQAFKELLIETKKKHTN